MLAPWSQDTLFIAGGGLAMDVVDGTEEGAMAWHHRWQWQYLQMAGPMGAAAVAYPGFQRGGCLWSGPIRKSGEGGVPQLHITTALRERGNPSAALRIRVWIRDWGGGGGGGGGAPLFGTRYR